MAKLAVSDLTVQGMLLDYVLAETTYRSAFVGSGAAMVDPAPIAGAGGNTWTARDLAPLSSRPVPADGTAATPVAHTPRAYIAPVFRRRIYANMEGEIAAALGAQNAALVQSLVSRDLADIFPREFDASLIDICKALFDPSAGVLRTSNSYGSLAGSATAAKILFNMGGFVSAKLMLGDNADKLQALVVHSKQWADIETQEGQRCSYQAITGPSGVVVDVAKYYAGKRVIVSDNVPTATITGHTVYSSFLVGLGTFTLGVQAGPDIFNDVEISTLIDRLAYRLSFGTGCMGVSWTGTPASATSGATAAEIQTATNWAKVAETKGIKLVEYRTN